MNIEYWIEEWYRNYSIWFSLRRKYPRRILIADFSNPKKTSEALKKFLNINLGLLEQDALIEWKHKPPPARMKADPSKWEKAFDLFDRLNLLDP